MVSGAMDRYLYIHYYNVGVKMCSQILKGVLMLAFKFNFSRKSRRTMDSGYRQYISNRDMCSALNWQRVLIVLIERVAYHNSKLFREGIFVVAECVYQWQYI